MVVVGVIEVEFLGYFDGFVELSIVLCCDLVGVI